MRTPSLQLKFDEIDRIIINGKTIITNLKSLSPNSAVDTAIESYIGGYAAVAICGIYEACIEEMFYLRALKTGDLEIANFMQVTMDQGFRNPDFSKIVTFVKKLDNNLARTLSAIPLLNRSAIDSLVNNKNDIAHGKSSNVTIHDVGNFHIRSIIIFETIENLFGL